MYRIFIAIIVIVLVLNIALLSGCIEKSSSIGTDNVKHENNAKPNDIETATVIEQDKVSKSTPHEKILTEAESQTSAISKYEIVSIKNVSYGNVKRYDVRVRVEHMLSSTELKRVSEVIIEELKVKQPHNALALLYYLPDSDTNGFYTAGKAEWAPYGDWSRADEVRTGNYSRHALKLFPGNATGLDPKIRVPGLPIETKKKIFFELVAAQDRGVGANKAYGIIANKFDIDESTVHKIADEGIANGWPMP
jgi:hypothetical protein